MGDLADRAQPEVDAERAAHLERQRRASGLNLPGSENCADCTDPIPLERREALPSAIRCVNCQAFFERIAKIPNHA